MTFYSKLTLAINLAFLPETSDVAVKAVDYLKDEGTDLVQERLKVEKMRLLLVSLISHAKFLMILQIKEYLF
jgi:hypothetical protein